MTTTNSDSELIKMDCIGRVRTTAEHREALLTAYEESALSGPEFCKHHGIKYQTFASWLQKHRRATGTYPSMDSLKKHSPLLSLSLTEVELPEIHSRHKTQNHDDNDTISSTTETRCLGLRLPC